MKPYNLIENLKDHHTWFIDNNIFKEAMIIRVAITVINKIDKLYPLPTVTDEEETEILKTI